MTARRLASSNEGNNPGIQSSTTSKSTILESAQLSIFRPQLHHIQRRIHEYTASSCADLTVSTERGHSRLRLPRACEFQGSMHLNNAATRGARKRAAMHSPVTSALQRPDLCIFRQLSEYSSTNQQHTCRYMPKALASMDTRMNYLQFNCNWFMPSIWHAHLAGRVDIFSLTASLYCHILVLDPPAMPSKCPSRAERLHCDRSEAAKSQHPYAKGSVAYANQANPADCKL
jgi:hypothetical protein